MALSSVAGILDQKGGLRVVVTQRWRMRHHLGDKEQLFVVPDYLVQEPVPWDDIPPLIERVQKHVVSTLAPVNHCGECSACCDLPYIEALRKPSGQLCQHYCSGFGCKIYQSRPRVCKTFECMWLSSQSRNDRMPAELRPDRCGAMFAEDTQDSDPLIIEVHGEPNSDAWRWIVEMQRAGYKAKKITHYVGGDA